MVDLSVLPRYPRQAFIPQINVRVLVLMLQFFSFTSQNCGDIQLLYFDDRNFVISNDFFFLLLIRKYGMYGVFGHLGFCLWLRHPR